MEKRAEERRRTLKDLRQVSGKIFDPEFHLMALVPVPKLGNFDQLAQENSQTHLTRIFSPHRTIHQTNGLVGSVSTVSDTRMIHFLHP
jgi:hypothetical protein